MTEISFFQQTQQIWPPLLPEMEVEETSKMFCSCSNNLDKKYCPTNTDLRG